MRVISKALDSLAVLGMSRSSRSLRPWSWDEVRGRTLAIYRSERDGHLHTALLLWQGDDPRVPIGEAAPRLIAFTMGLSAEPGAANAVALAGFESLEAGRAHCVDWAGATTEVGWDALGETAQVGIYAAIREPSFADGE